MKNPNELKSFFSNNLGPNNATSTKLQLRLDLLEKRVKLLETDHKKLNEKLKKILG